MTSSSIQRGSLIVCTLFVMSALLVACNTYSSSNTIARPVAVNQSFNYHRDIQPIFDQNCVACHACNDAPCQLKLESGEGLLRGATQIKFYDGGRLLDIEPTRLGIDALTVAEWREKGFFSVLDPQAETNKSVLEALLTLGKSNVLKPKEPLPTSIPDEITADLVCPTPDQVSGFVANAPHYGMPLGVAGLNDRDYQTLFRWMAEGAVVPPRKVQLSLAVQKKVERWETFFNQPDLKGKLVARYLFEHLFLAHLYFESSLSAGAPQFFKVVRSYTPAPLAVKPVTTVRPNGDPQKAFFYRIVPIAETIVHKTHITYALSDARMARFRALFLSDDWDVDALPPYDKAHAANPFLTFKAMPAKARYQFLLDNAEYFTRNFIRGPVCRGQIATDVIRDQFWVMYEDPDHDLFVSDPDYQDTVIPLLGLPGENSNLLALGPQWIKYRGKRNDYLEKRQNKLREVLPGGAKLEHIWDGDGHNENAFLTVFRHHNSASVIKGWRGAYPLTLWVMDYPLFERTYYELVVGFNVFGSVSHQAQTRLYFDLIRNGGEVNFLRFLPPESREAEYESWYQGLAQLKQGWTYQDIDADQSVDIDYSSGGEQPHKHELITKVLNRHAKLIPPDSINRCDGALCTASVESHIPEKISSQISDLVMTEYPAKAGIQWLPEVTVIRVDDGDEFYTFSLIRNRAHSNVAFLMGEELRYQPDRDTTSVIEWPMSSYPNFMFRVNSEELESFVNALRSADTKAQHLAYVDRWGVRRSQTDFWENFHSMTEHERQHRPIEAGIYDLNRYRGW